MTRLIINNDTVYRVDGDRYSRKNYYDYVEAIKVLFMQYLRRVYFRDKQIPAIYLTNFEMAINCYYNEIRDKPTNEKGLKTHSIKVAIDGKNYEIQITDKRLNYYV